MLPTTCSDRQARALHQEGQRECGTFPASTCFPYTQLAMGRAPELTDQMGQQILYNQSDILGHGHIMMSHCHALLNICENFQ